MMEKALIDSRVALYSMLASLYVDKALKKDKEIVLKTLELIALEPFMDEAKEPSMQMADMLRSDEEAVLYEFETLFNLPFGAFINSSASYYYDERELGEFTLKAKEIMEEAGYVKAESFSLGEDDFGYLATLSARLLKDGCVNLQKKLFEEVFAPCIGGFIQAQLNSSEAKFYKNAATLLALFVAFERAYFELYS